jgi:hypothetical protein
MAAATGLSTAGLASSAAGAAEASSATRAGAAAGQDKDARFSARNARQLDYGFRVQGWLLLVSGPLRRACWVTRGPLGGGRTRSGRGQRGLGLQVLEVR